MDQYYYIENGSQNGPFALEDLKKKNLKKNTQIWKEGMPGWLPVEELPELKDIFSSPPPPALNPIPFTSPDHIVGNNEQGARKEENKGYHKTRNSKKNWLVPGILVFLILIDLFWLYELGNARDEYQHDRSRLDRILGYFPIAYSLLAVLIVLLLFFMIFMRIERKKPGTDSINKETDSVNKEAIDSISTPDPDDVEIYIQKIKKGNKVDVNGILDEGGALLVSEQNGKQWRIDFRPFGKGGWMPHIKPGDEINIVGEWRDKKKYILVDFVYNKTTHKKGEKGFF